MNRLTEDQSLCYTTDDISDAGTLATTTNMLLLVYSQIGPEPGQRPATEAETDPKSLLQDLMV